MTILVKSAKDGNQVALWDRHPDHPGGEIFVSGPAVVEAAETPGVLRALADKRIVQVQPKVAKAKEVAK